MGGYSPFLEAWHMVQLMSLLRILAVLVLVLVASTSHAQERAAAQPFNTEGDITNTALLQKVSYLQQVVRMLEEQVRNCGGASGSAGETLAPTASDNFAPRQMDNEEGSATHTTYRAGAVAPTPAQRRPAVGYQVSAAAESRLTCADYSRTYFSRHPAMAAVCRVDLSDPQPATETEVTPTTVTVSVTSLISNTARPRQTSATTR